MRMAYHEAVHTGQLLRDMRALGLKKTSSMD